MLMHVTKIKRQCLLNVMNRNACFESWLITVRIKLLTLLGVVACSTAWGQAQRDVISLGIPYTQHKRIFQDLFVSNDTSKIIGATITCYDIAADSSLAYSVKIKLHNKKKKKNELYYKNLHLTHSEKGSTFNPLYKDIIRKTKSLPAGTYHTYLTLHFKDTIIIKYFIQNIDSAFSAHSPVRKQFDDIYTATPRKKFLGLSPNTSRLKSRFKAPGVTLKKHSPRVDKAFSKQGFVVTYRESNIKTLADVLYRERYVGYYEVNMKEPLEDAIEKRQARLKEDISSGLKSKLEINRPVFSQLKELYGQSQKKEVKGNISVKGGAGTGQEPNSQIANNFYDITSQVEVPIMNIPVTFEAYYTSQDKDRVAKAGYFRLHYDCGAAKEQLARMISAYKSKYDEAANMGKSQDMIYRTYLSRMQAEKDKLLAQIIAETGIVDVTRFSVDTSGLMNEMMEEGEKVIAEGEQQLTDSLNDKVDKQKNGKNAGKVKARRAAAMQRYEKGRDKYRKVQELEAKIHKYKKLLEQYWENLYIDSAMVVNKVKEVTGISEEDLTYKQLSKRAAGFLPGGHSKKFATGLTHMDIGVISKAISAYTLNGQTVKGADIGYDLGVCEAEAGYGRVEYVSRDGVLDRYSGYSLRAGFRPGRKQKATIIYYGYTPSQRMLKEEGIFKEVDVHMPTFKSPVHIVSTVYNGEITRHVGIESEIATSFRNTEEFRKHELLVADKLAYNVNLHGAIPWTPVDLECMHEHVGKQFENNTLPLNLAGTDRYSAGANGVFFGTLLGVGVTYNYLIQHNFDSKSINAKWGFEVKTTSKKYPSASVSFKPFTTYRSVSDTFAVQQRPIFGEVWLGKVSYQIKRGLASLRLTAVYNHNTSLADTTESSSNVKQLNALYVKERINLMLNVGQTQVNANQLSPVHVKTDFLTIAAGYAINRQWDIRGGQDIGKTKSGLSRYAVNAGCGYRFSRMPMMLQAGLRYNTYRTGEGQEWKNIFSGMIDMNWQFKFKMKEKT